MTFDAFEKAQETSQPIEIYRFSLGAETFEYTSAEDTQTISLVDYEPEEIRRNSLVDGPEERNNTVEIEVPSSNDFAKKYVSVVPGSRAQVTIQRLQRLDTPTPEVITLFVGFVVSVAFTENATQAKIAARPVAAATSRPIPRFTYSASCNNVLYDAGCKVDDTDAAFRLNGTISATDGAEITVPGANGQADGYWTAGFCEIDNGLDARLILEHIGNDLTLLLPFPGDVVGKSVDVLAGCDHTIDTCDTKFFTTEDATSNVINYGGFAFVPLKNIFSTGLD